MFKIADNITSPLGWNTQQNYHAVKSGCSAICRYEGKWGLKQPFAAALFSDEQNDKLKVDGLTRFESLVVKSVEEAVSQTDMDISSPDVLFVLSTTKADIEALGDNMEENMKTSPAWAVKRIAEYLGLYNEPVVVCNACISGVAAIITAMRMMNRSKYKYAVVCGADVQNKFTVAGFQSLQALAQQPCRPFDIERIGMNLGEAAATMVFMNENNNDDKRLWTIEEGAVRNDAFHVSSPSKNAEGATLALEAVGIKTRIDNLAFINAHGTATLFNDQMEAVAIHRCGADNIKVNALKGFLGHTLGAAGILETVLSMAAADDNICLTTMGFQNLGVSENINVTTQNTSVEKKDFVKMISGFGGGNAAIIVSKKHNYKTDCKPTARLRTTHRVCITPEYVYLDDKMLEVENKGKDLFTDIYKQFIDDYPKFYKMDELAKLGFIATELLIKKEKKENGKETNDRAVILFNHTSSVNADMKFYDSIKDDDNCFPSPSVFVYTLPNIVTGEIAIRNNYHAESEFYILDKRDDNLMNQMVEAVLEDKFTDSAITGWIDYIDNKQFIADLYIVEKY